MQYQYMERKKLGAFYTDEQVASFLVWWAIRDRDERVLDPCFGGGVFLRSACQRILSLGGNPIFQIYGVEIDPGVHNRIAGMFRTEYSIPASNLIEADFFDICKATLPALDVIVGNPPFIRYHRFTGQIREKALSLAAEQGVVLSRLCSSWAPFLIHSVSMLKNGGRLAMVVPAELGHANYAQPVVEYLARSFKTVTILTFRKRLFPDLNEDTFLLLAEGRGAPSGLILWRDLEDVESLSMMKSDITSLHLGAKSLPNTEDKAMCSKFVTNYISAHARELYFNLKQASTVYRLGDLARVGTGYVTGANEYFHLTEELVRRYQIPAEYLKPAVRRGRDLRGLSYTQEDWLASKARGHASFLLYIEPETELPVTVQRYIRQGEYAGVHLAYKCRVRTPWYSVPQVYQPDAFLTYMSGHAPRVVTNAAGVVAPNTLHVIRLRQLINSWTLAMSWQTSLVKLSCEIEGHSMGGGLLKLEPGEAQAVLIPLGTKKLQDPSFGYELDHLLRHGRLTEARDLADRKILQDDLGLTTAELKILREAYDTLRNRRIRRGAIQ